MNFLLDGMLGKLTRWLRMMGYDAKYSTANDKDLIDVIKKEKRILLTRDLALYQQAIAKDAEAFYVEGNTESERLAELAKRYGIPLEIDLSLSRCPKCNTKLEMGSKKDVARQVEKNTLLHYDQFWKCPHCSSVYWQGAHWTKIRATLEEAKDKLKKIKED